MKMEKSVRFAKSSAVFRGGRGRFGIFETNDVRDLAEALHDLERHGHAGGLGNVVEDERAFDFAGEQFVAGLHFGGAEQIVRRQRGDHGIDAEAQVVSTGFDGAGETVVGETCVNRDAAGGDFDGDLDETLACDWGNRSGFTGRAEDEDAHVIAGKVRDKTFGGGLIETASRRERRGHRHDDPPVFGGFDHGQKASR
ncbi:MAG: hypothetical protein QM760_17265 [Nibricoccus sp.]